jgi:hypothetical protein
MELIEEEYMTSSEFYLGWGEWRMFNILYEGSKNWDVLDLRKR